LDNTKQNIVKNIAQELDSGFDCYYNFKTDEIVAIPNLSQFSDGEDFKEVFSESLDKVEKHKADFIKIETLESFESFKIMEGFVGQLCDQKLQSELENALANKKPFQNFKHLIDHSDYRQDWLDFKQNELEKRVENELEREKPADNNVYKK
jgi:hypothetical protein